MARYTPFLQHLLTFVFTLIINNPFMSLNGDQNPTWPNILPYHQLLSQNISSKILIQKSSVEFASYDFGNLIHKSPSAVFFPSSVQDIASLIHLSYNHSIPFNVAARGRGHSCRGQAMVENGVVINMPSLGTNTMTKNDYDDHYNINIYNNNYNNDRIRVFYDGSLGFYYADIGGEQLWIDVLKATLEYGVFPASWTDYLYLSVGGTLSNGGISGQAFRYGPQISNVLELDVVTGKGELITCSKKINSELFYAVLGGLGQFGIITRARIKLEAAPKKVKWVRMLYDNFTTFTRDQEHLISLYGNYQELMGLNNGLNYVEGSLIMHQLDPNNWRSSFFTPNDQARIASLDPPNGLLFFLEVAKYNYYDSSDVNDVKFNKEVEKEIEGLNFIEGCIFTKEVKLVDFLNRVRKGEEELESKGMWDVPHPWLNMFIPRSQIQDLYNALTNIIANHTKDFAGPVLIYPLNRNKWDDNMSAVIPEEDVFYTLGLLHSRGKNDWQIFERKNEELLKYCEENGINIKQYLPYYTTKEDWKNHFGKKWKIFEQRKRLFDPKLILSPGQNIFQGQGLILEEDTPI